MHHFTPKYYPAPLIMAQDEIPLGTWHYVAPVVCNTGSTDQWQPVLQTTWIWSCLCGLHVKWHSCSKHCYSRAVEPVKWHTSKTGLNAVVGNDAVLMLEETGAGCANICFIAIIFIFSMLVNLYSANHCRQWTTGIHHHIAMTSFCGIIEILYFVIFPVWPLFCFITATKNYCVIAVYLLMGCFFIMFSVLLVHNSLERCCTLRSTVPCIEVTFIQL